MNHDDLELSGELRGCEKEVRRLEATNQLLQLDIATKRAIIANYEREPEFDTTDRGLRRLPGVTGPDGGAVRIFESSNALTASIWIAVTHTEPGSDGHAQLPLEHAAELARQLNWIVRNHYQVEQEPTGERGE